jgi:hypothetical protein
MANRKPSWQYWLGDRVGSFKGLNWPDNYHEVSWPYLLGNFCAQLEDLDNVCIAFIGTTAPASFNLSDVRKWFGSVPTYAADGVTPSAPGWGLLANPLLMGTTASKMNPLCADFSREEESFSNLPIVLRH